MKSRGVSQPLEDMVNFVVCRSTMNQFQQHNILCDNLHNSRKKSAYETLLTVTIQDSAKDLSKGRQVDIILLNFAKAFDKVAHARHLRTLDIFRRKNGQSHSLDTRNSKTASTLENCHSTSADVLPGVLQS